MAMRDKNECRFDAGHVIVDALILSNIDPAKTTKTLKTTTNPTTTTIAKTKTPSTTTTKTHFHATAVVTILAILLPNPSMQELSQIQPYRPIQPQAQTQTQPLHNNPEQPAIPVHLRQPDQRWLWRNLQSPTMAQVAAVDGLFQHDPTMRTRTSTSSASMAAQEAKTNASLNELAEKLGRLEGDLTTLSQNFLTLQRSVINLEQLQELLVSLLEDIVKPKTHTDTNNDQSGIGGRRRFDRIDSDESNSWDDYKMGSRGHNSHTNLGNVAKDNDNNNEDDDENNGVEGPQIDETGEDTKDDAHETISEEEEEDDDDDDAYHGSWPKNTVSENKTHTEEIENANNKDKGALNPFQGNSETPQLQMLSNNGGGEKTGLMVSETMTKKHDHNNQNDNKHAHDTNNKKGNTVFDSESSDNDDMNSRSTELLDYDDATDDVKDDGGDDEEDDEVDGNTSTKTNGGGSSSDDNSDSTSSSHHQMTSPRSFSVPPSVTSSPFASPRPSGSNVNMPGHPERREPLTNSLASQLQARLFDLLKQINPTAFRHRRMTEPSSASSSSSISPSSPIDPLSGVPTLHQQSFDMQQQFLLLQQLLQRHLEQHSQRMLMHQQKQQEQQYHQQQPTHTGESPMTPAKHLGVPPIVEPVEVLSGTSDNSNSDSQAYNMGTSNGNVISGADNVGADSVGTGTYMGANGKAMAKLAMPSVNDRNPIQGKKMQVQGRGGVGVADRMSVVSHGGPLVGPEDFSSIFMERLDASVSQHGAEKFNEKSTGMISNMIQSPDIGTANQVATHEDIGRQPAMMTGQHHTSSPPPSLSIKPLTTTPTATTITTAKPADEFFDKMIADLLKDLSDHLRRQRLAQDPNSHISNNDDDDNSDREASSASRTRTNDVIDQAVSHLDKMTWVYRAAGDSHGNDSLSAPHYVVQTVPNVVDVGVAPSSVDDLSSIRDPRPEIRSITDAGTEIPNEQGKYQGIGGDGKGIVAASDDVNRIQTTHPPTDGIKELYTTAQSPQPTDSSGSELGDIDRAGVDRVHKEDKYDDKKKSKVDHNWHQGSWDWLMHLENGDAYPDGISLLHLIELLSELSSRKSSASSEDMAMFNSRGRKLIKELNEQAAIEGSNQETSPNVSDSVNDNDIDSDSMDSSESEEDEWEAEKSYKRNKNETLSSSFLDDHENENESVEVNNDDDDDDEVSEKMSNSNDRHDNDDDDDNDDYNGHMLYNSFNVLTTPATMITDKANNKANNMISSFSDMEIRPTSNSEEKGPNQQPKDLEPNGADEIPTSTTNIEISDQIIKGKNESTDSSNNKLHIKNNDGGRHLKDDGPSYKYSSDDNDVIMGSDGSLYYANSGDNDDDVDDDNEDYDDDFLSTHHTNTETQLYSPPLQVDQVEETLPLQNNIDLPPILTFIGDHIFRRRKRSNAIETFNQQENAQISKKSQASLHNPHRKKRQATADVFWQQFLSQSLNPFMQKSHQGALGLNSFRQQAGGMTSMLGPSNIHTQSGQEHFQQLAQQQQQHNQNNNQNQQQQQNRYEAQHSQHGLQNIFDLQQTSHNRSPMSHRLPNLQNQVNGASHGAPIQTAHGMNNQYPIPPFRGYPMYSRYNSYAGLNHPHFGFPGYSSMSNHEPGEGPQIETGPSADVMEEIMNNLFQRYWENVRNILTPKGQTTTQEYEYEGPITTTNIASPSPSSTPTSPTTTRTKMRTKTKTILMPNAFRTSPTPRRPSPTSTLKRAIEASTQTLDMHKSVTTPKTPQGVTVQPLDSKLLGFQSLPSISISQPLPGAQMGGNNTYATTQSSVQLTNTTGTNKNATTLENARVETSYSNTQAHIPLSQSQLPGSDLASQGRAGSHLSSLSTQFDAIAQVFRHKMTGDGNMNTDLPPNFFQRKSFRRTTSPPFF